MSYTVLWLPDVEDELAALWIAAPNREAITRASHELDKRLQANAPDEGESRPDGLRIAFAAPLGILFQVDEPSRVVQVAQVWRFEKRAPGA